MGSGRPPCCEIGSRHGAPSPFTTTLGLHPSTAGIFCSKNTDPGPNHDCQGLTWPLAQAAEDTNVCFLPFHPDTQQTYFSQARGVVPLDEDWSMAEGRIETYHKSAQSSMLIYLL
jgi:phospholipase C